MAVIDKFLLVSAILLAFLANAQCPHYRSFEANVLDTRQTWIFKNDGGYLGEMKFNADGTISGYHNDNERYWKL